MTFTGLQVYKNAGSTSGLINGTDFTVSTDASTGKPIIKYTDATTNNLTYNETTLSISVGEFIQLFEILTLFNFLHPPQILLIVGELYKLIITLRQFLQLV